eukprot:310446-Heterocapsa_arctica.AAC.1
MRNPPHYRATDSDGREVPQVCLDYAFLRDRDETETVTCLVCKAAGSRILFLTSALGRALWSTV